VSARFKIGDVFRLSIDSQRVGFGQIVGKYGDDGYYFAIFEQPHRVDEHFELGGVVDGEIALLALSFDALQAIGRLLATVRRPNFAGRSTKKRVHPELSRPSITPARSDGRSMRSRQRRYRPPGTERIPRSSWSCAMARGVRLRY
jgi:hypothetical protein